MEWIDLSRDSLMPKRPLFNLLTGFQQSTADPIPRVRSNAEDALSISFRAALAAAGAVAIAQFLQLQFPIYALIAAVLVTDLSAPRTLQLAVPRLAGTILGAVLGAVINQLIAPSTWGVGLSVLAAMLISQMLRLHKAAKLAGYVCGIIILNFDEHPWSYAAHRVAETVLGIGMAVLLSLVPRLVKARYPAETT